MDPPTREILSSEQHDDSINVGKLLGEKRAIILASTTMELDGERFAFV
jgi:hypothetical protein